jgi:hypothetical protein
MAPFTLGSVAVGWVRLCSSVGCHAGRALLPVLRGGARRAVFCGVGVGIMLGERMWSSWGLCTFGATLLLAALFGT